MKLFLIQLMYVGFLDRYIDSSGVSGAIPPSFANLENLKIM